MGIFDSLGDGFTVVIVSIVVMFMTGAIFAVARLSNLLVAVKTEAEQASHEARRREAEMLKRTKQIQDRLLMQTLDLKQVGIVDKGIKDLIENVDPQLLLDFRSIVYDKRLGSGSFGDCYKGYLGRTPAAIKKMRVGLIDEEGFGAFKKEVLVLAALDHPNVVRLLGFCYKPVLLIVMDFVDGGTLQDWIAKQQGVTPADDDIYPILIGTARGMSYLHAQETPILHRDIKSENILLTKDLVPKIADLGEARELAENKVSSCPALVLHYFVISSHSPFCADNDHSRDARVYGTRGNQRRALRNASRRLLLCNCDERDLRGQATLSRPPS